jgi:hypothetical protein
MYIMEGGGNQVVLANISLAIVFITFIIIVGYHVLVLLFRDKARPAFLEKFNRSWKGQRRVSISDCLDDFDRDSHHLIEYTASKDSDKSDIVSVTKNAEDSTY